MIAGLVDDTFGGVVERVAGFDDVSLLQRLRELEADERRLAAERAVVLAELEERKVYRGDEHASMWGLLRSVLHWSDAECKTQMRVARLVRRFPDAGEGLWDTGSSFANVAEVARAAANPRVGDRIGERIGFLLRRAELAEHDEVRRRVRSWEKRTDVKGARERTESADEARDGQWHANDDGGGLAVEWGPIDAIANREILDRYLEAEWLADWDWTVARYGDQASKVLMPRTDAQRRADAVTKALHDAVSTPPGSKAPEPVVNVHVDKGTFDDILIEAEFLPARDRDPFESGEPHESDRICHAEHGDPIDPITVLQLMLAGYIRYVIRNDQGVPIRWGRKRRLFEGAARDAVRSMDTRCTHPGCRVRTKRTQTDHTIDHARGGPTDPDNANIRCRRHNIIKNQGYTAHRDAQGDWHTYRPDGTEIG